MDEESKDMYGNSGNSGGLGACEVSPKPEEAHAYSTMWDIYGADAKLMMCANDTNDSSGGGGFGASHEAGDHPAECDLGLDMNNDNCLMEDYLDGDNDLL